MRHHSKNRKFGRERGQRRSLFRSLAISLITHEKIVTSEAKAKSLRPAIEKLVTRARSGKLADTRILLSRLNNNMTAIDKLVKTIAPKYKGRNGGYTRITKLGARSARGDASPLAMIEFV
jgi:large subunit ribosomal protein L17